MVNVAHNLNWLIYQFIVKLFVRRRKFMDRVTSVNAL